MSCYFFRTTGGNIGILSSCFAGSAATGPPMRWEDPMTYPSTKVNDILDLSYNLEIK